VTVIGADDATFTSFPSCTRHAKRGAPQHSDDTPAPVTRWSHEEARMSNNPLWKRKLQDQIDAHNRQHGHKPKGVSNKTMHERACSLFRSCTLLRRLGFQIDPNNLAGRHIRVLVDYWTCNPRIADLSRQRGVAMLEHPHSTSYIQLQL